MLAIERISIELTNRCDKACWFCYAGSEAQGESTWTVAELVGLLEDLADHTLTAVSFGGGEPLQWPDLFELLAATRSIATRSADQAGRPRRLFRSLTSNGLLLDEHFDRLRAAGPDKIHVSIHFPEREAEVARAIEHARRIADAGIASGVNLLVRRSRLDAATRAFAELGAAGIGPERIVLLPMRGMDTPSADQVAAVAGGPRFQSMTCLRACAISPRFCSLGWDRRVGWCSYTTERRALRESSWAGLQAALEGLGLRWCGGSEADPEPKLVGLPRVRLA
ncbi:radical SAM protein [Nannocystaceae bacterium ST9]